MKVSVLVAIIVPDGAPLPPLDADRIGEVVHAGAGVAAGQLRFAARSSSFDLGVLCRDLAITSWDTFSDVLTAIALLLAPTSQGWARRRKRPAGNPRCGDNGATRLAPVARRGGTSVPLF